MSDLCFYFEYMFFFLPVFNLISFFHLLLFVLGTFIIKEAKGKVTLQSIKTGSVHN